MPHTCVPLTGLRCGHRRRLVTPAAASIVWNPCTGQGHMAWRAACFMHARLASIRSYPTSHYCAQLRVRGRWKTSPSLLPSLSPSLPPPPCCLCSICFSSISLSQRAKQVLQSASKTLAPVNAHSPSPSRVDGTAFSPPCFCCCCCCSCCFCFLFLLCTFL